MDCGCPRTGKSHNLVPIFLQSASNQDAKRAGTLLSDLHSDRVKADYRLARTDFETVAFAKTGVETAQAIKGCLSAFRVACRESSVIDDLKDGVAKARAAFRV
jgi:hypothetical protein